MVTTAKSYQAKKLLKLPKEMPSNIVSGLEIVSEMNNWNSSVDHQVGCTRSFAIVVNNTG